MRDNLDVWWVIFLTAIGIGFSSVAVDSISKRYYHNPNAQQWAAVIAHCSNGGSFLVGPTLDPAREALASGSRSRTIVNCSTITVE